MIHHYITHYARDGKDYAEAWIQINFFGYCFCLWKKRTTINRLYAEELKIDADAIIRQKFHTSPSSRREFDLKKDKRTAF